MADKKITALNENTTGLTTDDLFHIVDSPASSPSNKKITANTVFQKIPTWIGYAGTGIQAISNAGGTTVTTAISGGVIEYTNTGSGVAIHTLPNGVDGQQLTVVLVVTTSATCRITPTTALGFASLTLTLAGDCGTLLYTGATGWVCTSATSGSAGAAADMLT